MRTQVIDNAVVDNGSITHFLMIPNLIDDIPMSTSAFRLYVHLKRVAGETGASWQSEHSLSGFCGFSHPVVIKSKRELVKLGLITIETVMIHNHQSHLIRIVDKWKENRDMFVQPLELEEASVEVKQISAPKQSLDDYLAELRTKYPELDFDAELEKYHLYNEETKRTVKRPKLAIRNWMDNARRYAGQRQDNGGKGHKPKATDKRRVRQTNEEYTRPEELRQGGSKYGHMVRR